MCLQAHKIVNRLNSNHLSRRDWRGTDFYPHQPDNNFPSPDPFGSSEAIMNHTQIGDSMMTEQEKERKTKFAFFWSDKSDEIWSWSDRYSSIEKLWNEEEHSESESALESQ
jgi:hypothetical protein